MVQNLGPNCYGEEKKISGPMVCDSEVTKTSKGNGAWQNLKMVNGPSNHHVTITRVQYTLEFKW